MEEGEDVEKSEVQALSDEQLEALRSTVAVEIEARRRRRETEAELTRLAADYAQAVADDPPKRVSDLEASSVVGPGERIVDEQGVEWENTSLAFLSPFTAGPGAYPMGWRTSGASAVAPEAIPAWDGDGHAYQAGDKVLFEGVAYKVIQAHTSQPGWTPAALPALFSLA